MKGPRLNADRIRDAQIMLALMPEVRLRQRAVILGTRLLNVRWQMEQCQNRYPHTYATIAVARDLTNMALEDVASILEECSQLTAAARHLADPSEALAMLRQEGAHSRSQRQS